MKGISHFSVGVALATFIPGAMERALSNHSFDFLVAGVFGLLPDTLDFKFARFFEREDYVIDPDPRNLDANAIAQTIARAIEQANSTGKEIRVRFHTINLGPDRWRQYFVFFDTEKSEVVVKIGPIVTTSQLPLDGTQFPQERSIARVKVPVKLIYNYDKPTQIDILSGPTLSFKKRDGSKEHKQEMDTGTSSDKVEALFIPWHRQWSHSFTLGLYLGIITTLLFGWYWGLMVAVPFWGHVAVDCFGYMGGNLFWPFTKERTGGLKFWHASQSLPNFFAVWASILVVIYNANSASAEPIFRWGPLKFFAVWLGIPILLSAIYVYFIKPKQITPQEEQMQELLNEIAEGGDFGGMR